MERQIQYHLLPADRPHGKLSSTELLNDEWLYNRSAVKAEILHIGEASQCMNQLMPYNMNAIYRATISKPVHSTLKADAECIIRRWNSVIKV